IVDYKAARNERRRPERMTHGADSLCETNISQHLISSKVSQSQNWMPIRGEFWMLIDNQE
ncbi:hypothetical protein, partial [Rhizobium laguerreae]|uniref:hypothetical protein n=1 Tax=Rhizobium laguerreae TaxID=1076926 RepID=UPI001C918819